MKFGSGLVANPSPGWIFTNWLICASLGAPLRNLPYENKYEEFEEFKEFLKKEQLYSNGELEKFREKTFYLEQSKLLKLRSAQKKKHIEIPAEFGVKRMLHYIQPLGKPNPFIIEYLKGFMPKFYES